jgi:hypothetical protein
MVSESFWPRGAKNITPKKVKDRKCQQFEESGGELGLARQLHPLLSWINF